VQQLFAPIDVYADEAVFQEELGKLEKRVELALALRFRLIANVLAPYGIRLGLEFVGPHHLRNKAYPLCTR
jgi:hypothetical protein